MAQLIITNGDSAADILSEAGLSGRILPWRDVLHEGPLTPSAGLEAFSEARALYLSRRFGVPFAEARSDFIARDAVVKAHAMFEEITIWLEHDLYDQLQLLQILDFFRSEGRSEGLRLVQADDFLATQTPETVLRFADKMMAIDTGLLDAAGSIWAALCEPTPMAVFRWLGRAPAALPFLKPALKRFLEELPSLANGLTRTEQTCVASVAGGGVTPRQLFQQMLAQEEAAFMGDWSAFRILDDLAGAQEAPITGIDGPFPCQGTREEAKAYLDSPLALTEFGRSLLAIDADMIAVNGIDRWWAGTHLSGFDCWRWIAAEQRLVASTGGEPEPPEQE